MKEKDIYYSAIEANIAKQEPHIPKSRQFPSETGP